MLSKLTNWSYMCFEQRTHKYLTIDWYLFCRKWRKIQYRFEIRAPHCTVGDGSQAHTGKEVNTQWNGSQCVESERPQEKLFLSQCNGGKQKNCFHPPDEKSLIKGSCATQCFLSITTAHRLEYYMCDWYYINPYWNIMECYVINYFLYNLNKRRLKDWMSGKHSESF